MSKRVTTYGQVWNVFSLVACLSVCKGQGDCCVWVIDITVSPTWGNVQPPAGPVSCRPAELQPLYCSVLHVYLFLFQENLKYVLKILLSRITLLLLLLGMILFVLIYASKFVSAILGLFENIYITCTPYFIFYFILFNFFLKIKTIIAS